MSSPDIREALDEDEFRAIDTAITSAIGRSLRELAFHDGAVVGSPEFQAERRRIYSEEFAKAGVVVTLDQPVSKPDDAGRIDALASAESGDEGLRCALHVHVAGQPDDIDRCAECEHDLRATCHVRAAALPQPA